MKNKGMKRIIPRTKRELLALEYKFEFIRRNPKYIKEFVRLHQQSPSGEISDDAFKKLGEKWGIVPLSPELSWKQSIKELAKRMKPSNISIPDRIMRMMGLEIDPPIIVLERLTCDKFPSLNITINLARPFPQIMEAVHKVLFSLKRRNKSHLSNYTKWIRIYDARAKGIKFKDIAKKEYGRVIEKGNQSELDDAIFYTKRDYRRCKKMIMEGYKNIS